MQACSRKNYNMVSSVGKSGQNNYSVNSTTMPMKIDSPPATVKQIVHSKVPNGGAVSPPSSPQRPPSSPQRVTRSRIRGQKEELKTTTTTTKTLGASSNDVTSVTTSQERVVCPELAINYANTVISSRLGSLNSKQAELESKMARLSERLRHKQLQLANSHARKQLDFYEHDRSRKQNSLVLLTTDVLSEVEVDHAKALPVQVDGASEDKMAKPELNVSLSPVKAENSFSSIESSFQSSFQEDISLAQIAGRLEFSRQMVDEDVTDCSSDEEAETELLLQSNESCENLKREWERTRTLIGSKWCWLERKISELNKQICHLDWKMQRRPNRDNFTFKAPRTAPAPTPYLTLSNGGALLEQIHHRSGDKGTNGVNSQFLPQLLLPGGISSTKLQVKDLLASSALGKNFSLLVEESGQGCARTSKPLERRAKRKIIRKAPARGRPKREGIAGLDPSYHPKLSLPHELPSRLLLDAPVKQILKEHSYSLQPLSKRRKAASSLAHLFTPRSSYSKAEHSTSPSPLPTPSLTPSTVSKVNSRRKLYHLTHQSSSQDLLGPSSPPTWPDTPTQAPPKKRRALTSTPSYDIDNIVIPYSMAASTRPEKPEYKEIITPRWREVEKNTSPGFRVQQVDPMPTDVADKTDGSTSEEDDLTDEAFVQRHEKCEQQEKKRFMNFISGGGQRKRNRPSSSSNGTPDSLSINSPQPFSSTSRRRGLDSPISFEVDLTVSQYLGILPWTQRNFPLSDKDFDALANPPPPPSIVRGLLSPRQLSDSQFKSRTPSIASTLATPLSSPVSTPSEETPSISPTEWMVVNTQLNEKPFRENSYCKPTNGNSHIVLKLSKRA